MAMGESRSVPIPDTVETFTGEGGEEAEVADFRPDLPGNNCYFLDTV